MSRTPHSRAGAPVGVILFGALLITAPQLPAVLAGQKAVESFAVALLVALLASWAGCEMVLRLMHHYAERNAPAEDEADDALPPVPRRRRDD